MNIDLKQAERQQRGKEFEAEMRRSWAQVPNCWRMDISSAGGSRPADDIIILPNFNILAEYKRTTGTTFELSFLEPNQITGLLTFEKIIPSKNFGMVFVSFLNENEKRDRCFFFRLTKALQVMKDTNKRSISLETMDDLSVLSPFRRLKKVSSKTEGEYWSLSYLIAWLMRE